MRKFTFMLLLLLGSAPAFAQQKLGKYTINYYQGSFEQFKGEIIDKGKPGFVLVVSNRQWKSKDMEINLNDDSELVAYIDSNFIAYRVETEEDYAPIMDMRLEDVPALVVYSSGLKMIGKIEGKKEPDGLMQLLESAK
jgi:hypothetical protein